MALELCADAPDAQPAPTAPTLLGRYRAFQPPIQANVPLSLGEGRTPLLESAALGPLLRLERLAFKLEAANPTGSWIDRGTVALVQRAREAGVRRVAVLAHGGLATSTARYAARAGLRTTIVAAEGPAADGPAAEGPAASLDTGLAIRAGARLIGVPARPRTLATALRRAAVATGTVLVNADDPVWAAGLRTLAFELVDTEPVDTELIDADGGLAPDLVVIASRTGAEGPALAAGFRAWRQAGLLEREPAVLVVRHGSTSTPNGLVVDSRDAGAACRLLVEEEGIAASPSSAAALAGVVRRARAGEIAPDARVVVVLDDARPSLSDSPADDPQLVGRVRTIMSLAELPRALTVPAF